MITTMRNLKSLLLAILFITTLSKANDFIHTTPAMNKIKLDTILSGSHKSAIKYFDFDNNNSLLSVSRDNVKMWDISNQELLNEFNNDKDYIKAEFSKDMNFIYLLSQKKFSIYDRYTFKELSSIALRDSKSFVVSTDNSRLFLFDYGTLFVYDLNNKKILYKLDSYGNDIILSLDNKYFTILDYSDLVVYKSDNGVLINKIKMGDSNPMQASFISNNELFILFNNQAIAIYNFKTNEKIYSNLFEKYFQEYIVLNDNKLLFEYRDLDYINFYDMKQKESIKLIQLSDKDIGKNGLKLSDNKKILAVGFSNGNLKLYDTSKIIDTNLTVTQPIGKVIDDNKTITPPLPVKKIVQNTSKPTFKIVASRIEGIVPFQVTFSIIPKDIPSIDSYYINLAGSEKMSKGEPPMSFKHTFTEVGKFKVFVALKGIDGEIIENEVMIDAKEETFSDFMKTYK